MVYIYIKDWSEWQSYRKDRGTPPWIKVHRNLLSNPKWAILTDSEKGQLVSLWIVAADNNGKIPNEPMVLKKICQLDEEPNISKFKDLGFLTSTPPQLDANLTPTCQPSDAPETETNTEAEAETYSTETETEQLCTLNFNIDKFLNDKLRQQIKEKDAKGLDFNGYLIPEYNKMMIGKEFPKNHHFIKSKNK